DEESTDVVKVVDFGIAKFNDTSLSASSATRTGSVLGTPHYMSPEQARGLRGVDARSDLWSVAVIAYRCLVGALPFEGEAVGDLLVKLCTAPIPVPSQVAPDVPPGFDAWLHKALTREPAQRFQTALQLSESFAGVCGFVVRGQDGGSGPYAALGSGSFTAVSNNQDITLSPGISGATAASPLAMSLLTGAPTTQTQTPPEKRSLSGARVAMMLAALLTVGIGGIAAGKFFSGAPAVGVAAPLPAPSAAQAVANPAPRVATPPSTESGGPSADAPNSAPALVAAAPSAMPRSKPLVRAQQPSSRPAAKPAQKAVHKPGADIGF
ncbi:MAG TPA: hypothetical protein VFK05_13205, partial [Polyangiaceae bacterium]|nr:hypothetical protein [Polyangiaceae bacterium]